MNIKTLKMKIEQWVDQCKKDVHTIYFAMKHPETPWYAKAIALVVVAYAMSPIDLIPDFIPILGYLDDVLLLPLGIALTIWLVPQSVIEECRIKVEEIPKSTGRKLAATLTIVGIWILLIAIGLKFII